MADRIRISYITRHSPYPQTNGGRIRVSGIFNALQKLADVSLIVLGDSLGPADRSLLRAQGIRYFPALRETRPAHKISRIISALARGEDITIARMLNARRRLKIQQLVREHDPHLIILGHTLLAPLASSLAVLRIPMILDTHNVESELARSIGSRFRNPLKRWIGYAHAYYLERLERRWVPQYAAVWAVSNTDAAWYQKHLALNCLSIVPNVIDVERYPPPETPKNGHIVFVGWYRHWPNIDAAKRLINISGELNKRNVKHQVQLIGRDLPEKLRNLAKACRSVEAVGEVEDVRPFLAHASVVAAPLYAGSGSNLKVIEAMAAGKPVVTTPQGVKGFSTGVSDIALVANNDSELVEKLQWCLEHPEKSASLGLRARTWVEAHFSQKSLDGLVAAAVDEALGEATPSQRAITP